MTNAELSERQVRLQAQFDDFVEQKLNLDLTRGKPASDQLDLSNKLDGILDQFYLLQDGTDVRNYGGIMGIPEARQLGADLLSVRADQVMVGGNSSLSLMYAYIAFAHQHGIKGPGSSWQEEASESDDSVRFLCPVPGYDRHFTICEHFGIEMINIPMGDEGPDMDLIEELVGTDPRVKGIWCVPKYSNPTGHTYSDNTVKRLARLGKKAGRNFRIMWDNAYAAHHLTDTPDELANIMTECAAAGTEDNVVITGSTSKITFAGGGISFLASSNANLAAFEKHLGSSVIGFDKVNQLRHVRFLKDKDGIAAHMEKHRALLSPKFESVEAILSEALSGKEMGTWTRPRGGYFVSFDTLPGLADKVCQLSEQAGVKLTPAGATFPYGRDPNNSNIRLAPTYANLDDLDRAMRIFVLCVQLATVDHQLEASA